MYINISISKSRSIQTKSINVKAVAMKYIVLIFTIAQFLYLSNDYWALIHFRIIINLMPYMYRVQKSSCPNYQHMYIFEENKCSMSSVFIKRNSMWLWLAILLIASLLIFSEAYCEACKWQSCDCRDAATIIGVKTGYK